MWYSQTFYQLFVATNSIYLSYRDPMPKTVIAPKCEPGQAIVTFLLLVMCIILTYLILRYFLTMMNKPRTVLESVPLTNPVQMDRSFAVTQTYGKSRCFDCESQIGSSGNPSSCFSCDKTIGPNPDTCFDCLRK